MLTKRLRVLFVLFSVLFISRIGLAHPMGNFSINHYSKIILKGDRVEVRYFIDLAEIPAYQELQQGSITASPNDPAVIRFISVRGTELGSGLSLAMDGKALPLRMISSGVIFPPGAGDLPTMKMGFVYEAAYPSDVDRAQASLHYADNNYPGHSGWKEITAVAPNGSVIRSPVPSSDRSAELSDYPTDLLSNPPQSLEASLEAALPAAAVLTIPARTHVGPQSSARPADTAIAAESLRQRTPNPRVKERTKQLSTVPIPQLSRGAQSLPAAASSVRLTPNQQMTPRSRFTELITAEHISLWFLFTAALVAMGLGALHALEPGHGKTIVAAYLVGSRGTARHAVLLGMIVTASHTAGVFGLGAITLYASRGVFSGITIAGLGSYMFLRRLTGTATDHSHVSGSLHSHWLFSKRFIEGKTVVDKVQVQETSNKPVSLSQLFTLGVTGGIIPCPAALIVLLSAVALHRIALGFFLIVAFSLGLATVLIGFGMVMVYARRLLTNLQIDGPLTKRWLPLASSAFITILGVGVAIQAFSAAHFGLRIFSRERLGPLIFVTGLGLILGMRHSTDADHVVAISTIVSKQRSIRNAAFIGSVWDLGHTITIFVVGSLIILFGVEIPPRVGLSMEFSVAIMLILLGVFNLTGLMQRVTSYFTPADKELSRELDSSQPGNKNAIERLLENTVDRFGL